MDWAKKDEFFNLKVPIERVTVEGVGDVKVHGLSLYEKEQYEKNAFKVDVKSKNVTLSDAEVHLLLMTVHNQHGQRLFDEKDIGRLRNLPAFYTGELLRTAKRLSAIGEDEIKDIVKNSPTAPKQPSEGSATA